MQGYYIVALSFLNKKCILLFLYLYIHIYAVSTVFRPAFFRRQKNLSKCVYELKYEDRYILAIVSPAMINHSSTFVYSTMKNCSPKMIKYRKYLDTRGVIHFAGSRDWPWRKPIRKPYAITNQSMFMYKSFFVFCQYTS